MVLRLTIAPSGAVTNIGVVSSELGDSELERRLLARIKAFNFGEKDVDTVTVTYPIHFFPS
jgi:TonB family protein